MVLIASFYLQIVEETALLFSKLPFAQIPLALDALGFGLCLAVLSFGIMSFYKSTLARAFGLECGGVLSRVLGL